MHRSRHGRYRGQRGDEATGKIGRHQKWPICTATRSQGLQGEPSPVASRSSFHDTFLTVAPLVVFLSIVLFMGVYIPRPLDALLHEAAASLGAP